VFDVTQTEGREIASFTQIEDVPGEKLQLLESVVQSHGIELHYEEYMGAALGRSEGGKITVRRGLSPAENFSVLAHELGHEMLHRTERRKETTRNVRELEAEAVSFVVCKAAGLDGIQRSADYIQLYAGDKAGLKDSLDHIQKVASRIIEELLSPSEMSDAIAA
jgi:hypothetical protein